MSTLIGLKQNDTAILATDSRACSGREKRFVSDAEPKIFEVAPGVFYGYSGHSNLAAIQVRLAATLGRIAEAGDLRTFADELDAASTPHMERLVAALVAEQFQENASGAIPFHSYILCGVSEGEPGFLGRQFWIRSSKIWRDDSYNFHTTSAGWITPGEMVAEIVTLPETWEGGIIPSAERLLDHLRRVTPFVGGPTQMVSVDRSGPQWIHQPIQASAPVPAIQDDVTGKTAMNLGSALGINPTTRLLEVKDVSISEFASNVRPIAIFTSNPALPDAKYPTGTFGKNVTTGAFLKVNAAGNAWVPAVNGAADVEAGTITADRLNVASVSAAFATISFLTSTYITAAAISANYATFGYLGANYATIGALNAKTITADKITGGTCSATVSFTAPSIDIVSGNIRIQLDAANRIKVTNSATRIVVEVTDAQVRVSNTATGGFTVMTAAQLTAQDGSGNWMSMTPTNIWRNGSIVL